jgi:FtsH-binding integral membrane protein
MNETSNQTTPTEVVTQLNPLSFIKKVYVNLAYGLLAFIAFSSILAFTIVPAIMFAVYTSGLLGLIVLVVFGFLTYWLTGYMEGNHSKNIQYTALFGYAFLEAILFSPLLVIAKSANILLPAIVITLAIFAILTAIVLTTKKDFSFLGSFLKVALIASIAVFAFSMAFRIPLITVVTPSIMILIASGYILYDTSNILRKYKEGQEVAAAGALLASLLLLFWYVIRLILDLVTMFSGD